MPLPDPPYPGQPVIQTGMGVPFTDICHHESDQISHFVQIDRLIYLTGKQRPGNLVHNLVA